ncbi:PREDICTED: cell division cycle-associated protein 4-like [Cyprinodon variegatus]|uniref:cell division cycle-associated protein 4-like n=1 Tax=Cyprinodon variegatus TaxID=28743 RepID=UPI000742C913|nr:PREDICTED: cell division cycle-associated protein 4-like [Cyprinodon variegatus]
MLGRGVKRKWSCLEELEADELPNALVMEEKKQNGEEDKEQRSSMSHLQQRQLVFSLCLQKLQHYQAGMELSLHRSVLLINTLRQIQEEMRSDGSDVRLHGVNPDACLLRGDFESVTCPGCAEGDGESLSLSADMPSQEANGSTDLQKSPPNTASNTFSDAGNTMGYLSDLPLDDIFEDIDTSMYETSDLPSAWGAAGSLWPVSVSFWPDEDIKSRSSAGSLQSCLLDLNELDHIMEILVKS